MSCSVSGIMFQTCDCIPEWMLKEKKKKPHTDKPLEWTEIQLTLDLHFLYFCNIVNAFWISIETVPAESEIGGKCRIHNVFFFLVFLLCRCAEIFSIDKNKVWFIWCSFVIVCDEGTSRKMWQEVFYLSCLWWYFTIMILKYKKKSVFVC